MFFIYSFIQFLFFLFPLFFFTNNQPTLTHHNNSKTLDHIRIHFWCWLFDGFGQMSNNIYPYKICIYHLISLPCKILWALPIYLSLPSSVLWKLLNIFIVSVVLPFPECLIFGLIWYIAYSDWLHSLTNMHLCPSMSFHGLIAHFYSTE